MPALKPPLRVGHKGAAHIEQGNTIAAFEAAVACDVDMLEFDVLPENVDGSGALLLAHDYKDLAKRRDTVLTLDTALDHLAGTGLALDVDLKLTGYEDRVVAALRERELPARVLISTMEEESLRHLRAHHPDVRLGWSVPKARRDYLANPATKAFALGMLQVLRRRLPVVTAAAVARGEVDAVMAHWSVVTARFVRALDAVGGELYVWTVDDAARIAALEALGVTGIITNDPRLFGPRA